MKTGAFFLAIVFGVLLIEPAFTNIEKKKSACTKTTATTSKCSKYKTTRSGCSMAKSSCPKQDQSKKECPANRCNPLLGCPAGNFYIVNGTIITIHSLSIPKQKTNVVNDNRVSKQSNDCWHPPEIS